MQKGLGEKKMSKPIKEIEGIGPKYADKLANVGVYTVHARARDSQTFLKD